MSVVLDVAPVDLATLPMQDRREYLRVLWDADVAPDLFVSTARRLGYTLVCHWDLAAGMPVMIPMLETLH